MNQGMYGISSGGGTSGSRKLAMLLGRTATPAGYVASMNTAGCAVTVTTVPTGARTRVLSATGKGALRALNVYNTSGTSSNLTIELSIDGAAPLVVSFASASSTSLPVVGFPSPSGTTFFTPDYVPYESSLDVYVTTSAVANPSMQYLLDIHQ